MVINISLGYLIVGAICAFIGYTVGEKKAIGAPAAAVICFFLPLVGLIIVLLLPDEKGPLSSDDFRRNLDRARGGLRRAGHRARDAFDRGRDRARRRRDDDDEDY